MPPDIEAVASIVIRKTESVESRRIYRLDLMHFWNWIREKGYTYQSFDEVLAFDYKDYLKATFARATAQRMLSVTKLLFCATGKERHYKR